MYATKLKKATYYKYIVKAYKMVDGKKVITGTSVAVHSITKDGKYGVAKAVSIIKIGNKKNDTEVTLVTVTSDSVIKAMRKGNCKIWVYAQNGVYKVITVTVK